MPLTRDIAFGLMGIVPERGPATVMLAPNPIGGGTRVTENVNVFSAWEKPISRSLTDNGHLNLQGDESLIKIPDNELNPNGEGREIRAKDFIIWQGSKYRVTSVGTTLKTVKTVWECACNKVLS